MKGKPDVRLQRFRLVSRGWYLLTSWFLRDKAQLAHLSLNSVIGFVGEKMKLFRILFLLCFFFSTIFFGSYCSANLNDDQKLATEFMERQMYPQAIALWEKVSKARKNDPEVFFMLGICNARLGKFDESEKWFAKAIQSNVDYAYKIGGVYFEAALYLKEKDNILSSSLALSKAKMYDPNIEKEIEKRWQEETDPNGIFMLTTFDIKSKFVDNAGVGKLFVVSGKVKNGYTEYRCMITLVGKLFSKGKVPANQETVYCGNILSDFELANLEWDKIKERLSNRLGDTSSNVKIEPGKAIPFMVVFSGLPDDLEEFTIEVSGSKPL